MNAKRTTVILMLGLLITLAGCASETRTVEVREADGSTTVTREETGTLPAGETDHGKISLDEVKQKSGEALNVTAAYMNQEKERLSREMHPTLKAIEHRIDELRQKADKASGPAQEKLNRQVEDLEARRVDLKDLDARIKKGTQSTWDNLKTEWGKLRRNIQDRLDEHKSNRENTP